MNQEQQERLVNGHYQLVMLSIKVRMLQKEYKEFGHEPILLRQKRAEREMDKLLREELANLKSVQPEIFDQKQIGSPATQGS